MQSSHAAIGPKPDDRRSTATEQKFDWDGGTEFACGRAGFGACMRFSECEREARS
jgi:hypothetical protein